MQAGHEWSSILPKFLEMRKNTSPPPRLGTGRDAYIQDCDVTFYPDWIQAETLTYKTATSPSTQSRDSPRRDSTVFLQDVSRLERRKALSQWHALPMLCYTVWRVIGSYISDWNRKVRFHIGSVVLRASGSGDNKNPAWWLMFMPPTHITSTLCQKNYALVFSMYLIFAVSLLVSWYFEPSQPQRITSWLKTMFNLSPIYSAPK